MQDTDDFPLIDLTDGNQSDLVSSRVVVFPYFVSGPNPQEWQFMAMKPRELKSGKRPRYQLAQGKRMVLIDGEWRDMPKGKTINDFPESAREPLGRAALREGLEELGLLRENVLSMADIGTQMPDMNYLREDFGPMRMIAVAIKDKENFGIPEGKTKERQWMTEQEFSADARLDHLYIPEKVIHALEAALSAGKLRHIGIGNSGNPRTIQR